MFKYSKINFKNTRGFTLIELLVVIAIIGILSSVVLSSLNSARAKSRDARRKMDIVQIQKALELYYSDNGQYPASSGAINPNTGWNNSGDSSWVTLETTLAPYISKLSSDPKENGIFAASGGFSYSYFSLDYGCTKQWYMLVYRLENAIGPDYGVASCDGTVFKYGGAGINTAVKTVGSKSL